MKSPCSLGSSGQAAGHIIVNIRATMNRTTGVQRYTMELLKRFGSKVHAVGPDRGSGRLLGHPWEQFVLPGLVRRQLLWSPANTGPLMVKNQVVTVHDASPLRHPEWFDAKFASWYGFLLPRLTRRVAKVITDSEFSRQELMRYGGVPESNVVAIPLGVDARFKPASRQAIDSLNERLGLANPYILFVGSLDPRKNLRRLFKAWEQIEPELAGVDLVVSGADGMAFRSSGFDHVPDRVRLVGYIADSDLPTLYSGAELFVFPSLYEGFGLPPLEAMACGTPVVTSNVSSLPEVVGDAAVLSDPESEESLASAIRRVMGDCELRGSLRTAGLKRAGLFTWETTAQKTWSVLTHALESA